MTDTVAPESFSVSTDETARVAEHLVEGKTLPLEWYTSPEVAEAEKKAIFASSWHYVGRAADVEETGMFVTADIGDVPIVIVRDRDGSLNAFHNVCRHRAAKVVLDEKGQRRTLQCHYHAWTYGLDGSLKGAPRSASEECFPQQQLGLRKASAQTWGPFLFAHLDDSPADLFDQLGEVPDLIAAAGIDVDGLNFHFRSEYDIACNWKVAMENYLECYHCPTAHPGFSDVLDTQMDAYQLELEHTFAWQNGPLRPLPGNAVPRSEGYTGRDGAVPEGRYFAIFPNLKININPGLPNLSIGPMVPTGPDDCHGILDYFFSADVTQQWIDDMLVFDDQVGVEDRVLVESVQQGIRSGSLTEGRIMLQSEALIGGFQKWVLERYAEGTRGA
ncbi:aromatic ring-hydroxylating oxygenase subunit alpha [Rhodococcus sp. NM-2]|uniref:aromatic ring-hydroxylating oxygenase subunit alpha n=1 Tax=Rhodococcus sp. NM-2 TaxID=3401174 RepID=UPI003AAB0552